MNDEIYIKYLYLNDLESEYIPYNSVDLKKIAKEKGIRGFRLSYKINGIILDECTDILFGKRISLQELKAKHYDNDEYKKYIDELEESHIKEVALINDRYYFALYECDMTFEEYENYIVFEKIKQEVKKHELISVSTTTEKSEILNTIAKYYDRENDAIIPFIFSIINKTKTETPEGIIDYLFELKLPEIFICEIVSVVSMISSEGEKLLEYWNLNYYILKSSYRGINLVKQNISTK